MLPEKRPGPRRGFGHPRAPDGGRVSEPGRPLVGSVRDVEPLRIELVREPAERLLFRELAGRYHYRAMRSLSAPSYLDGVRTSGCRQRRAPL